MEKKKLYLIDGANYLFRAYYALPALSNSKGFPTGALYGYAQMLLRLIRDEKPDYIAVCFDSPEPTFRDGLYDKYKANRKEPPDDLKEQFPLVMPLTEAMGIKSFVMPGYEADDIIGTIAVGLSGLVDVVIVSGDKDLMQLVGEGVSIFDQMKGLRIGPEEVKERFGVGPDRVVEVLGLAGDSSDNIPGVPGVGIKTAMKLVAEYGTFESILDNAGSIKGAIGKKILENKDIARLSLKLVQIDKNVPIKYNVKDCERGNSFSPRIVEMFKELEFTKLLDENKGQEAVKSISYEKYLLIDDEKALDSLGNMLKNKNILSIDLETTSLDVMKAEIVGASIAWGAGEAAYLPVGHLYGKCLGRESFRNFIASILSNPEVKKLGQNLNYDLSILKRLGFDIDGIYFDTMLASYLINAESEHGLDAMATKYLGHRTIRYEDVVGKGKSQKNFSEINPNEARDYACEDADVAFRLFEIFKDAVLDDYAELFFGVEMPLMEVLVDMQLAGMKVDAGKLSLLDEDFSERIAALEKKIHEIAGESFNVASPKQLGTILFEKLRLPSAKKTKTGFSTSQDILEELALEHELPRFVIEYRSLSKLKSTYVDALRGLIDKKTGRIHTSFNQARTATGRLSSSEPNLQNIPAMTDEGRKIREAFVAEDGFCLVSADYSQIELRVLAHMSGDENLVDAFVRKLDVHAITASGIFGVNVEAVTREQRAAGKTVNFATIYGQGAYGLARQLSITPAEAGEYIENYFGKYPGVGKYRDEILSAARKNGYVETLFGRRRFFSDINSKNRQFSQMAERMAFNTVFQGTAADIIKMAMVKIHAGIHDISPNSRMLLQVHDELVFETPIDDADKVASFVKSAMEGAATLKIPLIVDIGRGTNWADAH